MRELFSLSPMVKRMLPEDMRVQLCRILGKHYEEALIHWPDDPIVVGVGEDTYELSSHPDPRKAEKVSVRVRR